MSSRRERIISKSEGHCAYPACDVSEGLEIDHIIPLWMGGTDSDENLECLCVDHHKSKTKLDAKMRAKVKRLTGETGAKKENRTIKVRPFCKLFTKGFDGKVRPRKERPPRSSEA